MLCQLAARVPIADRLIQARGLHAFCSELPRELVCDRVECWPQFRGDIQLGLSWDSPAPGLGWRLAMLEEQAQWGAGTSWRKRRRAPTISLSLKWLSI